MITRGEKREAKRRKRGKHKHKVDGAGVRLLHAIIMGKARKAAAEAKNEATR